MKHLTLQVCKHQQPVNLKNKFYFKPVVLCDLLYDITDYSKVHGYKQNSRISFLKCVLLFRIQAEEQHRSENRECVPRELPLESGLRKIPTHTCNVYILKKSLAIFLHEITLQRLHITWLIKIVLLQVYRFPFKYLDCRSRKEEGFLLSISFGQGESSVPKA